MATTLTSIGDTGAEYSKSSVDIVFVIVVKESDGTFTIVLKNAVSIRLW